MIKRILHIDLHTFYVIYYVQKGFAFSQRSHSGTPTELFLNIIFLRLFIQKLIY